MLDYQEERSRRVAQFAYYFRIMAGGSCQAGDDCFLVFSELPYSIKPGSPRFSGAKPIGTLMGDGTARDFGLLPKSPTDVSSRDSQDDSQSGGKFVQFSFQKNVFAVDLPNTTICPSEVHRLFRDRSGFMREADLKGRFLSCRRHVEHFDPVCKAYIYGDTQEAAEDVAFIFFDLWRFPIDSVLFAKASVFDGPCCWEQDGLLRQPN